MQRPAVTAAVPVLLAAFVGLVSVGAALQPGYSHGRDYISSLASVGARGWGFGAAAIAALALAHAAAAPVLRRTTCARLAAVLLLAAATAGLVVAAARISCPDGAAGCATTSPGVPGTAADTVHGPAVAAYAVLVALAMLAATRRAWRWGRRGLALASPPLALVSLTLVLVQTASDQPGGWQRAWLATNGAWLLLVAGGRPYGRGRTEP